MRDNLQPFFTLIPVALVVLRVVRVSHGQVRTELSLIGTSSVPTVIFGALAPVIPYLMVAATAGLAAGAVRDLSWDRERTLVMGTASVCLGALTVVTTPLLELAYLSGIWLVGLMGLFSVLYGVVVNRRLRPAPPWGRPALVVAAMVAFLLVQMGFDDRPWLPPDLVEAQATHIDRTFLRTCPHTVRELPNQRLEIIGYIIRKEGSSVTLLDDCRRDVLTLTTVGQDPIRDCRIDTQRYFSAFEANLDNSATLLHHLTGEESTGVLQGCSRILRS